MIANTDLLLIRHAEADTEGRLCGRTDVGLSEAGERSLAELHGRGPEVETLIVSPARRCHMTAQALWPSLARAEDARLWEQDFGAWDGQFYAELPDVGTLSRDALADLAGPEGESFRDLCARAEPAIRSAAKMARQAGPVAVVAHAGIVRAGLSLALGGLSDGLAFEIDPLSVTRFRCLEDGFSIRSVNEALA